MSGWAVLLIGTAISGVLGWLLYVSQQELKALQLRLRILESQQHELQSMTEETQRIREAVFRVVGDGLMLMDADQKHILAVNPTATALLGQNLIGETLIAATRSYDLDQLVQEANEEEFPERMIEHANRFLRGKAMLVSDVKKPFYLLTLRDETELHRLGRARREMVANISHELRHPIATTRLLVDTLLNGALKKPKEAKDIVKSIRRQVSDLSHLVEEMRDLSLIESGQMPVKLIPVDLRQTIDESIEPLRPQAEHRQQQISIEIPVGIIVLADPGQIQRVIKNIVHNAIKFAPEDGIINLAAATSADEVTVAVSNNGPNIPTEDLPRIFERFFQVSRSRSDGTGLGLAIARHIVLSHGGRIWVVNNAEGEGVTFFFTLGLSDIPLQSN